MKIKEIILKIENINFDQALEYVVENVKIKDKKTFITTINSELVMLARKDKEYEKVLKSSDLAICDGIGIVWAGKIFGKKFKGRIHGVDLVEKVSEAISNMPEGSQGNPISIGFLGGHKNVAQRTAECLINKYPGLNVAFAVEEWPSLALIKKPLAISKMSADILFVAFGSPKQEKWIYENLPKIDVKVAIGVGGAFDFISGEVRRAPKWIRNLGLEWLFRLFIQPWRIKRQLVLPKFVMLVFIERILG